MIIVVQGGSGCGKSALAEDWAVKLARKKTAHLYYLATMQVYDAEGEKKVERHRRLRSGKGFQTLEQPLRVEESAEKIVPGSVVLLECLSNLTANEMFTGEEAGEASEVAARILSGIECVAERAQALIIVTNNVFEDGILYDDTTTAYMQALGMVNRQLAKQAQAVVESVVGIPVFMKGAAELL